MKKNKIKFLALLLITSVAFFSCKKGDPIPPHRYIRNTSAPATNNPTFSKGDWRISLFSEKGVDETNLFNGYVFMFNDNGTIKVTKDNNTMNGNWYSAPGTGQKFMINFSADPLNVLNKTWDIKGETYTDLKLVYINSENGEEDLLTFKRNQQEMLPDHSVK